MPLEVNFIENASVEIAPPGGGADAAAAREANRLAQLAAGQTGADAQAVEISRQQVVQIDAALPGRVTAELSSQVPLAVAVQVASQVDPKVAAAQAAAVAAEQSKQDAQSSALVNGSFTTLALATAAIGSLAEGHSYEVTADSTASNIGIWTKRSGVLVQTSIVTVQGAAARAVAVEGRATVLEAEAEALADRAPSLRVYSGSGDVLPDATALDGSGTEFIVRGLRRSDGATIYYVAPAGPGFTEAVNREVEPIVRDWQYLGAGPLYPIVAIGPYQLFYFDETAGRLVLERAHLKDCILTEPPSPWPARLGANGINGLIVNGESLSVGNSAVPPITTTQPYSNVSFAGGPRASGAGLSSFAPLVEVQGPEYGGSVTDNGETICSGAANHAVTLAAVEAGIDPADFTIFSCCPGKNGVRIDGMDKGTTYYNNMLAQVTAARDNASILGRPFVVHAMVLVLGANDANIATPRETFRDLLLQYVVDMNADLKAITGQSSDIHLLVFQAVYKAVSSGGGVMLAQMDAVAQSPLIHFVAPMYQLRAGDVAVDHLHLSARGEAWLARYAGRAFQQLVVEGRKPDCIWPLSASAVGTRLRIKFRVPAPPLVFDTTNLTAMTSHGFAVRDGTGSLALSSPAIIDGDTVEWTLSRALGSLPEVDYALSYADAIFTSGGAGNLRDSTAGTVTVDGVSRPLWHVAPHFRLSILKLAE